jgi:23S rRNA pseudouridine1911/1915/1917 synthase
MISQQVQQHRMLKEYTAIVTGSFNKDHGTIDKPIARREGQVRRVIAADGQAAVTEYWVEKSAAGLSRVRARLHTGRTHQIRVHFAAIGHPLVGDSLYGGNTSKYQTQLLHASKLAFTDPFSQKQLTFTSPLPNEFEI